MYAVGFLDLAKDGPTVIDLPPGMLGVLDVLDDMAFRYMTDLGIAGPDKGKGGKFLVLPPHYEGDVPDGYFMVPSKTNGVWVFTRGYLDSKLPLDKAVPKASANIREHLKVYPLKTKDNQPATEFINVPGKVMNTVVLNDYSFFEKLHDLIQGEPDDYLGPEAKGMMAACLCTLAISSSRQPWPSRCLVRGQTMQCKQRIPKNRRWTDPKLTS